MEVQASMSGVKVVEEEKAKVAPHPETRNPKFQSQI